jgi:hypothetical protein
VDASWLISGATQPEKPEVRVQSPDKETLDSNYQTNTKVPEEDREDKVDLLSRHSSSSKIKKIVVFYDDQTFEEFNP